MRVRFPLKETILKPGDIYDKKLRYVFPAPMVNLKVKPRFLQNFHGQALTIDILPLE